MDVEGLPGFGKQPYSYRRRSEHQHKEKAAVKQENSGKARKATVKQEKRQ